MKKLIIASILSTVFTQFAHADEVTFDLDYLNANSLINDNAYYYTNQLLIESPIVNNLSSSKIDHVKARFDILHKLLLLHYRHESRCDTSMTGHENAIDNLCLKQQSLPILKAEITAINSKGEHVVLDSKDIEIKSYDYFLNKESMSTVVTLKTEGVLSRNHDKFLPLEFDLKFPAKKYHDFQFVILNNSQENGFDDEINRGILSLVFLDKTSKQTLCVEGENEGS